MITICPKCNRKYIDDQENVYCDSCEASVTISDVFKAQAELVTSAVSSGRKYKYNPCPTDFNESDETSEDKWITDAFIENN